MFFSFRRSQRQWKLAYTFIYQGQTVSTYERFLTKAQAEQHFAIRRRHHARLVQPIVQASLKGPDGFQKDLLPIESRMYGHH